MNNITQKLKDTNPFNIYSFRNKMEYNLHSMRPVSKFHAAIGASNVERFSVELQNTE